jgi:hypothetical protein
MEFRTVTELILALGAVFLLGRDMRRTWVDQLRRPVTLLVAALMAGLLIGSLGERPRPSPWWLVLPSSVLLWEVGRGWRRAPRCHLWEAGVGAFGVSLLLAATGLGGTGGSDRTVLLAIAALAAAVGVALVWRSRREEPRPWRVSDTRHYERRVARREITQPSPAGGNDRFER